MHQIKVVTWNIHGGVLNQPKVSLNEIKEHTRLLSSVIESFDADVLLLQEVHFFDAFDQLACIKKHTSFRYSASLVLDDSHLTDDPQAKIGIAILTKKSMTSTFHSFFPNLNLSANRGGSRWESHEKGVLASTLHIKPGARLTIACLHLLPLHKFMQAEALQAIHDDYMAMVSKQIGELFAPFSQPLLLGGDFNANEVESFLLKNAPHLHLIDVPFDSPTVETYKFDHILVSNQLKIKAFRVLNEHQYSDHFPCMAVIEIP